MVRAGGDGAGVPPVQAHRVPFHQDGAEVAGAAGAVDDLAPADLQAVHGPTRSGPAWPAPARRARACGWGLRGLPGEVLQHLLHGDDVPDPEVDVEQGHLVQQLAALAHRLPGDDHAEPAAGVAAGGVDAVAGGAAGDDQGVRADGGQHLHQVGALEAGGVLLDDQLLFRAALQARVELHRRRSGEADVQGRVELRPLRGRRVVRPHDHGGEEDRHPRGARHAQDAPGLLYHGVEVAAEGGVAGVGPGQGQVDHHHRRACPVPRAPAPAPALVVLAQGLQVPVQGLAQIVRELQVGSPCHRRARLQPGRRQCTPLPATKNHCAGNSGEAGRP